MYGGKSMNMLYPLIRTVLPLTVFNLILYILAHNDIVFTIYNLGCASVANKIPHII